MAEISVKGYVNNPKSRESAKGGFSSFTLAERQKQKDGTFTKVYYDVVDFNSPEPPPESSFATISGWLSVRKYQKKDGGEGTGLNINAQKIEVAPPRDGSSAAGGSSSAPPEDPFDLGK